MKSEWVKERREHCMNEKENIWIREKEEGIVKQVKQRKSHKDLFR